MSVSSADDFRASFFEECEELLEAMHDGFGVMIDQAHDEEAIHVVFRAVHSIKGGAGAFGLDDLVAFAHHFETALDQVRAGRQDATHDVLMLFQHCGDHLSDLVTAARTDAASDQTRTAALNGQLDGIIGTLEQDTDASESFEPMTLDLDMFGADLPELEEAPLAGASIQVTFVAEPELFTCGNEPALLFKALSRLGDSKVSAHTEDVPALVDLDPMMSHVRWTIHLDPRIAEDDVHDVFDFVSDCALIQLERSASGYGTDSTPCASGAPNPAGPTEAVEEDVAPSAFSSDPQPPVPSAPSEEAKASAPSQPQTIRVDCDRVDKLINLVGELVIKEAMLTQAVGSLDLSSGNDLMQEIDGLKQIAAEIQEGVMAIRAQPVKPLFQRMARTIRDASTTTGKRVRLVMRGETSEVDKTVLERLVDPLNHMIRNAVDHGLESTEERLAAGKPEEGTVTLSAAHRSGRVVIEISDDGGGINRDRVRKHAEGRGLISPDTPLTPAEIDALLFMPGFSLKEEVSELSGRGVGLDVVRSEIVSLGGRMSISSDVGKGTVFSISLPLTLAVLEGMVVDVAGQTMVVPITAIQETLQSDTANIHSIGSGNHVLSVRDGLVPVADLGAMFGFRDVPTDLNDRILLVIETETERRCALIVDGLQDQRQVVIKSLETNYSQIDGVSAATILGDGRIALIVDPDGIVGGIAPPQTNLVPPSSMTANERGSHVAN